MKIIIAAMAIAVASPAFAQTGTAAQPQAHAGHVQHGQGDRSGQSAHRCCCEEMMQRMHQGQPQGQDEHSGHEAH